MHLVIPDLVRPWMSHVESPRLHWSLTIAVVLAGCHLFYWLVEWPSHQLARRIRLSPRPARSAVAASTSPAG